MFSTRCHLFGRNILVAHSSKKSELYQKLAAISSSAVACNNNYYESLGIPKDSTQSDIKAAYYKLSMIYHPDKNLGNDSAAIKFKEIAKAYEVLGNYRLRRLYDKGVIHAADSQSDHHTQAKDIPDDPETKFYKSRFTKSTVADTTGRTPIYDFDEWSRQHYGKSFERRQAAKLKFDRQEAEKISSIKATQNEIIIFGMVIFVSVLYMIFVAESALDTPKEVAKQKSNVISAESVKKV